MKQSLKLILFTLAAFLFSNYGVLCSVPVNAANSYLPHWEHIPDGEPRLFEDPDNPGKMRVYIYGSHDTKKDGFCGYDLVTWSAPVENLNDWRYEGIIFESIVNGKADTLFAPDVVETKDADGKSTYYLYPNNQSSGSGRSGMIAKSDSPVGPFEVCNWKPGSTTQTDGVLGFDPAVFVDDDGRVYGYWGFNTSYMAELDPDTMCTVKEGCKVLSEADTNIDGTAEGKEGDNFRFFEASSLRKVEDKYVFIYSRTTKNNEFGLGASNSTLAYAYSDTPLGPWTYGGTLIDARARETDQNNNPITVQPWGNTHGSILEINGQWYVFYHRCINKDMYSRQATVEPIEVSVTPDGKVEITEAEVTSQGFEINGLNPYKMQTAGSSCFLTGNAYIPAHYDEDYAGSDVTDISNNSIVGFKYLNFDAGRGTRQDNTIAVKLAPKGTAGTIDIMLDRPWLTDGGTKIATVDVPGEENGSDIVVTADTEDLKEIEGKHALYFVFKSSGRGNICDLKAFQFGADTVTDKDEGQDPLPETPSPEPDATATPDATAAPGTTMTPGTAPGSSAAPGGQTAASGTTGTVSDVPSSAPAPQKGAVITAGGFEYTVTKTGPAGMGTVTLKKTKKKTVRNIRIPDSVTANGTKFLVTAIDKAAFKGCKKATKLTIGKNVTQIANQAFQSCSKLKSIQIKSAGLKKVGKNAFKGIDAKAKISVPKKQLAKYKKLLKGAQGIKKTMKIK